MDKGGDSGPMGKHRKDLDKEVSPLLVKHFYSSCEDKNLDKSVPHHLDAYNLKSVVHVGGEQSESSLIDHRGLRNTMMICCNKSQENQVTFRDQYTDSVNAVTTNMKVDLTGKDMTSYSPVDEVVKLTGNHESDEACTPSSFVPLKDHLDLNSWQRPEICSLYRKKGISKLYPWQVDYLQVEGVLQIRNLLYCDAIGILSSTLAGPLVLPSCRYKECKKEAFTSFVPGGGSITALVVVQGLKSSPNLCWDSEEETMSFKSVLDSYEIRFL
ncbi:hypothetical protein CerSpe_294230 [Prunus speciosa]